MNCGIIGSLYLLKEVMSIYTKQTYLLKFQDNSVDEKMASSRKFHSDNDEISITKDEIDVEEVFNHIKGKLNDFRDEFQFIKPNSNRKRNVKTSMLCY